MSLSTRFLNLSMKEQICITIILLTLFCILVILIVCGSLMYEILNKDYEQQKIFIYDKYKKYVESVFYFQSFYIMEYGEIIHRMQKEFWRIRQSVTIYQTLSPLQDYSDYIINMTQEHNFTKLEENKRNDTPYFYIISYDSEYQEYVRLFSLYFYQTFVNSVVTNNVYNKFKMPGYGVPIFDDPVFFNYNFLAIFGCSQDKIANVINYLAEPKNTTLADLLEEYYYDDISYVYDYLEYASDKLYLIHHIFPKFTKELLGYSEDIFINETLRLTFCDFLVGYFSYIYYDTNYIYILSSDYSENYFFAVMNSINETLFFLNKNLTYSLDIDFIPLMYEDDTIISEDLCSIFKIKQNILAGNEFNFEQIYSGMEKGISNISDCFINKELLNSHEDIKDIFDIYLDYFTELNNIIYQGIFNLISEHDEYPFYFMKYSYPNYNTLKEFQTEYLYLEQVNFYSFASFIPAQKYVDHVHQISQNIFFFIVLIIIYCWFFCLFINIIIFFKIIDDLTEPITKLQDAVESNSIKDENIFKYKHDDIINELFLTCKELLSGQIDINNENELKNFHISKKENENNIDKNIYKKNLIINNEIMEELINKQQSMMDFSNNIKTNEFNSLTDKTISKKSQKKVNEANKKKSIRIDNNKNSVKENIKTEKNEDDKAYINLFKISEYLDYYRSKSESHNNIYIDLENNEETKTSKIISKKDKSSSISNQLGNDEINDNNYINMLDETDITYLWYMESKKKNKTFNYNISNNCKELFTEFEDSNKPVSKLNNKRSISKNKKEKYTEV